MTKILNSPRYSKNKAKEAVNQALKCYENGRTFLQNKNLLKAVEEWINFYQGDQWAGVNLDIPKPIINFIKMIIDSKIANCLSAPITLNYEASKDGVQTKQFNQFSKYICKEIGMKNLLSDLVTDAYTKGTGVLHLFWDNDGIGKPSNFKGSLKGEIIDFRNLGLADPTIRDIQKQKWITIAKRIDIKTAKAKANKKCNLVDIEAIKLDDNDNQTLEQEESGKVTLITRYFRIDGEVYYEQSIKGQTLLDEPKPLNPFHHVYIKMKKELEKREKLGTTDDTEFFDIDLPTGELIADIHKYEERYSIKERNQFYLYPIEILVFNKIDGCSFGFSDIKEMIPTQKAVNIFYSALIKNGYDLGFPRHLIKRGALKGKISGKIGEAIYDDSPYGSWGISILQGQSVPNSTYSLPSTLIDAIRTVKNSTEVMTGEVVRDLSGVAITALQGQAEKSVGLDKEKLLIVYEKVGKILELFYKFYYQEKEFFYEVSNKEYQDMLEEYQRNENGASVPYKYEKDLFIGANYLNTTFNIIVEAGTGIKYSEMYAVDLANNLIMNGNVEHLSTDSLELLLKIYPNEAMPFKEDIKEWLKQKQQNEKALLLQELQSLKAQTEEKDILINNQEEQLNALQNEFTEKIKTQNEIIDSMSKFMKDIQI